MPQMRSFQFQQGPSLPQAYATGVGLAQTDTAEENKVKLTREQIANQYAMAEMEAATKRSALAQQALQQAQELEVEKSYRQQQIGLKQREQESEQQKVDFMLEKGAQQYRARQAMRGVVEEQLRAGKTPGEALSRGAAIHGTDSGAAGQLMGDIVQTAPGGAKAPLGRPVAMPLLNEAGGDTGELIYQSSQNQYSRVPKTKAEPTDSTEVPRSGGRLLKFGNKTFPAPEFADFEELKKEAKALDKKLEGDDLEEERRAFNKAKDPKNELNARQALLAEAYAKKLTTLEDMQKQINLGKAKFSGRGGSTNSTPKRRVWNPTTRRLE